MLILAHELNLEWDITVIMLDNGNHSCLFRLSNVKNIVLHEVEIQMVCQLMFNNASLIELKYTYKYFDYVLHIDNNIINILTYHG